MKHYRVILFVFLLVHFNFFSSAQNKDSSRFIIQRLSINSRNSDFSPFLYNKKLYFSSGREHSFGIKYINTETSQDLIDMYFSDEKDSVDFKKPQYFSDINSKYNDGPACISKDGTKLFITRNDLKRVSGKNKKPLSIYLSGKTDKGWSKPEPLNFCTGVFSYCHPSFSTDGKTLFFSADIKDGQGGMDLYYSTLENGIWTIPRNLGPKINGPGNEVFPFVSTNNILYFSTNRNNGYGGLDIYAYDLKDQNSDIQILEAPVNSLYDDFGIWLDSSETSGYFSSGRDSTNSDDIFYFKNRYPDFENCTPYKKSTYCYTFFEESTLLTQDTLGMIYEWDFGDGIKKRGLEVKHCFAKTGNYLVQLNIIEKASGNVFYNELSYDFVVEEPPHLFVDCADTIAASKEFSINIKKSVIPNHTIKSVYWFFGDGKFAEGDAAKHTYDKDGIYTIKLGALAINDSTKKTEKFCSQKMIVVKDSIWISQHAHSSKSIKTEYIDYSFSDSLWNTKYKPYFNSTPSRLDSLNYMDETDSIWIAKHKTDINFIPSTTDTLYKTSSRDSINYRVYLGRSKKNIPVSAAIFTDLNDVKKYKEKDGYSYTSGEYKKITNSIPEYKKAKEKGFNSATVVGFYGDSLIAEQESLLKSKINSPAEIKSKETLSGPLHRKNILFDFDKAIINRLYYKYLDSLTTVLKENKKFELIILAASDSVGTSSYNKALAKKRAAAVQDYFIAKGIAEERLDVNTIGENMPKEYGPNKFIVISNRRVEILLVKKL